MKNTKVIVALFSLTAVCGTSSSELHARPDSSGFKGKRLAKQLLRLDTDQNQQISLEEMLSGASQRATSRYKRKDTDQDGLLSFTDATAHRELRDLSALGAEIVSCISDIKDETGNERIVVPEESRFVSPQNRFNNKDTNGDNMLSLDEVKVNVIHHVSEKFAQMDTDNSAEISLHELKAAKQIRRATGKAIRVCIRELTTES